MLVSVILDLLGLGFQICYNKVNRLISCKPVILKILNKMIYLKQLYTERPFKGVEWNTNC